MLSDDVHLSDGGIFPGVTVAVKVTFSFFDMNTRISFSERLVVLITVTTHEALAPEPSVAVAVMVAVPRLINVVTTPFWSTSATSISLEDHESVLFVAFVGKTVAVRVSVWFRKVLAVVWFNVMDVTGTLTVTVHEELTPVSSVANAVMTATPVDFATTFPFWSTVATLVLLDDQVSVLLVASDGKTVAVRVKVFPLNTFAVV